MGALPRGTHSYHTRILFNSTISTARSESQVHKNKALQWYQKWASFKNISPGTTYAQALLKNSCKNCHTIVDHKNACLASENKTCNYKTCTSVKSPVHANLASHKFVYHARKTKTSHNTKNVPVALCNRFKVLAELSDENNGCSNHSTSRDSSLYNTELDVSDASGRSFQHSIECKDPSSRGSLQPLLAVQENSLLYGNKNETGFLAGDNQSTKTESHNDTVPSVLNTCVLPCRKLKNVIYCTHLSQDIGNTSQPNLAVTNHTFLGNKNKTGFLNGDAMDANLLQVSPVNGNENHGDVIDIMDTESLDQVLNQNCSLNRLNDLGHVQKLSCHTLDTKGIH